MERFRGLEQAPTPEKEDENLVSDSDESFDVGGNGKQRKLRDIDALSDSRVLYTEAIREEPLLTPEEAEFYFGKIRDKKLPKNERELAALHVERANLRLAMSIANKYHHPNLEWQDVFGYAVEGLIRAVNGFDPEKGFQFSTYATKSIERIILRRIAEFADTVRKPVHVVDKIAKINRAGNAFKKELGREPTREQLSEITGYSIKDIDNWLRAAQRVTSLDISMLEGEKREGDSESSSLYGVLPDKTIRGTEEEIKKWSREQDVERWINNTPDLTDRERKILRWRYTDDVQLTLEEISDRLGVHRNRVQQLEQKAIRKLRNQELPNLEQIAEE
jgi:RNA polymerase sigma factor (sigma-70 family)